LDNRLDFTIVEPKLLQIDFPKAEIYPSPRFLHTSYLVYAIGTPPLNDPRVRKAIGLSINRHIFDEQYGIAVAQGGFIPPGMPGHSPDIGLPYDVELARKYLSEAGFPGGQGFPALTVVCPHGFLKRYGSEFHRQWQENLGIEVHFQGAGNWRITDFTEKRLSGSMIISGWIADYPDPDTFMDQLKSISMPNFLGTMDPSYDQLVDEAARTSDRAKRMKMYRQADRWLVQEQAILLPLSYGYRHLVGLVKPWIKNLSFSRLGGLSYQDIVIQGR
jgi:oligopeptide transport system substrate-binding protein